MGSGSHGDTTLHLFLENVRAHVFSLSAMQRPDSSITSRLPRLLLHPSVN
jgi:hypothetical protein